MLLPHHAESKTPATGLSKSCCGRRVANHRVASKTCSCKDHLIFSKENALQVTTTTEVTQQRNQPLSISRERPSNQHPRLPIAHNNDRQHAHPARHPTNRISAPPQTQGTHVP